MINRLLLFDAEHVLNSFCPTGKGGGVDPTCPSKIGSSTSHEHISSEIVSLWHRAGQPNTTTAEISKAFDKLKDANFTVKQLESIVSKMGFSARKLPKEKQFNRIKQAIVDRKGATDRASI